IVTCSRCGNQAVGFFRGVTPGIVRVCVESAVEAGWIEDRPIVRQVAFSNPPRCVTIDLSWLTSNVLTLAEGIYQDQAFDRLPILADALEDSGCADRAILDHCRSDGDHIRGCWVVDLLLDK